jgi:regulator of nonsense transcripts 2
VSSLKAAATIVTTPAASSNIDHAATIALLTNSSLFTTPAVIDPASVIGSTSTAGNSNNGASAVAINSELDTSSDFFRAQLVCELLNTCGSYYVRGQARERLARFLTYFQKYLLTKVNIPMHVEFTILDTLDYLEDQARAANVEKIRSATKGRSLSLLEQNGGGIVIFPRYNSLEAVQVAIEAIEVKPELDNNVDEEEMEDRANSNNNNKEGNGDGEQNGEDVNNGENNEHMNEDEEEDEDVDDEDQDGEEEGEDDGMSNKDAARMLESLRIAEEDEEFEKAFRSVMQVS